MSENLSEKDLLEDLELIDKINSIGLPTIASCTTMNIEEASEFLKNKGVDF